MNNNEKLPIAVENKELIEFGCPECGCKGNTIKPKGLQSAIFLCKNTDCNYRCVALLEEVSNSSIGIEFDGKIIYPTKSEHPRRGIPRSDVPSFGEKIKKLGIA